MQHRSQSLSLAISDPDHKHIDHQNSCRKMCGLVSDPPFERDRNFRLSIFCPIPLFLNVRSLIDRDCRLWGVSFLLVSDRRSIVIADFGVISFHSPSFWCLITVRQPSQLSGFSDCGPIASLLKSDCHSVAVTDLGILRLRVGRLLKHRLNIATDRAIRAVAITIATSIVRSSALRK